MWKRYLPYFWGFLIFQGLTGAIPALVFLLVRAITDNFRRSGFEDHFVLILFLVLLAVVAVPVGSIWAYIRLRRSGKKEMANGMMIGLALTVATSWLLGYLEEREETKLLEQQEKEIKGWQPAAKPDRIDYRNEMRDWEQNIDRPDTISGTSR